MSSMVILDGKLCSSPLSNDALCLDDELDELVGGPTAAERMEIESLDRSLDNAMEKMRKGKKEPGESKSKSKSTSTKLCILEEVLSPIISASQASRHAVEPKEVKTSQAIAEFEDIKFTCEFGDEMPRVRINQRALQASKQRGRQRRLNECELCHGLQEAVSNILDNALKYVLLKDFKRRKKPFVSLNVLKGYPSPANFTPFFLGFVFLMFMLTA